MRVTTDGARGSDQITVQTKTSLCGDRIHLHQMVRKPGDSRDTNYVVVGCDDDKIEIIDCNFQFDRKEVDPISWQIEEYEAVVGTNGVPYFAY